jgi:hypothetical protein
VRFRVVFGDSRTTFGSLVESLTRVTLVRFDIFRSPLSCVGGPRFRPDWPDETWGTRKGQRKRRNWVKNRVKNRTQKPRGAAPRQVRSNGNGAQAESLCHKRKRPNLGGSGALFSVIIVAREAINVKWIYGGLVVSGAVISVR